MQKTVLITGGSGLIGTALTSYLLKRNYTVRHLGRTKKGRTDVEEFTWDLHQSAIDEVSLIGANIIVHLAGQSIGKGRWTDKQKKEIHLSRSGATKLLFDTLENLNLKPEKFISSSGVGYYGLEPIGRNFKEDDPPGTDFAAQVCIEWENSSLKFEKIGVPVLILRPGVVLSSTEGILPVMTKPVKMFMGAPIAGGNQMISWIHIDDLCKIYLKGISDPEFSGIFNAVGLKPVTNKEFMKALGKQLNRPIWPVHVPGWLLRLFLGEQAEIVIEGIAAGGEKIRNAGVSFDYPDLTGALEHLFEENFK